MLCMLTSLIVLIIRESTNTESLLYTHEINIMLCQLYFNKKVYDILNEKESSLVYVQVHYDYNCKNKTRMEQTNILN